MIHVFFYKYKKMEPTDIIRENRSVREYKNKKISELKKR